MNYDMIIFDIDGTLWNIAELITEASNIVASNDPMLKKVTLDDINRVMGLTPYEIAEELYPYLDSEKRKEAVETALNLVADLIEQKGGNIYDGVSETLISLSKKYKLGIVTNNINAYAELLMKKTGLTDYFTDYIGVVTYDLKKAEAIKLMVERNNVTNACYVGDIKKDMDAATEAGIDFIHAKYGFEKKL